MPAEFRTSMLIELTGWPPTVLDEQPQEELDRLLMYLQIVNICQEGGTYE